MLVILKGKLMKWLVEIGMGLCFDRRNHELIGVVLKFCSRTEIRRESTNLDDSARKPKRYFAQRSDDISFNKCNQFK